MTVLRPVLRVLLGAIMIVAAYQKVGDLGAPIQTSTVAVALLGRSESLWWGIAAIEALLGAMLVVGLWPRSVAFVLFLGLLAGLVVLVWFYATTDGADACGCFGQRVSPGRVTPSLLHHACLVAAAGILVFSRTRTAASAVGDVASF